MARRTSQGRRGWGYGWLATGFALVFMIVGGFGLGLVAGIVLEEPTLVAGHVAGRTTTIDWGVEAIAPGEVFVAGIGRDPSGPAPVGAGPPPSVLRAPRGPKNFAIQVGAFEDPERAASLAERLRNTGYPVEILEPLEDDRWRVRVGPLTERAEAEELALRLKVENRLPTWIRQESGAKQ